MAPKKSGKSVTPKELSMDDMRRLGMTDEQIQEITTLRRLTLEEKRVQKEQRDQAAMERDRAARAAKREAERQAALQLEAAQQEALIRYATKEREEELNRMAELRRLVEERRRLIDEAKETLLEIDETDREWSEAEERHLFEIALAEREARERGVAKPRSVHRDVLLSRCCRDPLFATMALVLYAERLVQGSPRLPPIFPMMMQMVNTHSEEWIPVNNLSDDGIRSSPRWNHYVQCCGDVGAIRLMKPLARLRGIKCNQLPSLDLMRTISYHGARSLHTIDLSFTGPKVDIDWTSPVQDKDDDFRRTLQWLGSLSHLRAVTLRGSLVGSVAGLELLPRLTHLSLSGTMVTDVNVIAAAQGLRVLDLSHTPVTSDGIRNLYQCEALEDLNLNFCSNDLYIHALTRSSSIRRLGCRRSHVPRPDPDGLEYARVACRIATIEVIEVSQITCEDVGPICAKRPPVKLIIDLSKSFNVFKQFPALLPFMPSLQIASTNSNFDSVAFDWSRFNHLTEVAVVSRFNHAVIDLNRLAELTSLQILHLDHQTSAVGSLKRARSLQELTLLQCSASATDQILHDLCFLPRLEKVECVSSDLKTLTIFNGCERLKSLRIEGCTSLLREDKTFVNVPLLERIVIKECEKFTDAQSLLSLPSIAHLTLTKTGVIDEKIFERQVELLSQKRLYNSWFKTHSSNEDQP